MAYIPKIPESESHGRLAEIYSAARGRTGHVAQIIQLMSLDENAAAASLQFYLTLMQGPAGLPRSTREMLATVVSHANDCFY